MIRAHWTAAAAVVAACAVGVAAQNQNAPAQAPGTQAPHNLQVLPRDTTPQDVLATMQGFTRALGVQCTYCHIEAQVPLLTPEEAQAQAAQQGQGAGRGRGRGRGRQAGPPMDFAADVKSAKQTARVMLRLVHDVNATLDADVPRRTAGGSGPRVECMTCHRGVPNPRPLPELLSETMLGKGEGAAISLYRELRLKYDGTAAYDFSEAVLIGLAHESLAAQKPDDALAWLQLNVEFYPKSVASYLLLSQAHLAKRDRDAATKDLEKALEIDPQSVQARRQLSALRR